MALTCDSSTSSTSTALMVLGSSPCSSDDGFSTSLVSTEYVWIYLQCDAYNERVAGARCCGKVGHELVGREI